MSKTMRLSLRAGEKIYLNGAVLRADRKVTLEILNDATFLLEGHVMQVEETATPLRQLYYIIQSMLMDPAHAADARALCYRHLAGLFQAFSNASMLMSLDEVGRLVTEERCYDALRALRGLFPLEDAIMGRTGSVPPKAA
ncbi:MULTISPECIES: flagellar biosynthesis repressor FlbT [unclassified Xanthobacter]|uniref:flagellar biosynthesis repressor FlbT n=1 Tax=unclassified Xanthobacter TaxID=2623496 RepID=UPI001EE0A467|nr:MULTISPECIES: flagellar biosynthesis repressor FlbT [unclassified Xanthobacter]